MLGHTAKYDREIEYSYGGKNGRNTERCKELWNIWNQTISDQIASTRTSCPVHGCKFDCCLKKQAGAWQIHPGKPVFLHLPQWHSLQKVLIASLKQLCSKFPYQKLWEKEFFWMILAANRLSWCEQSLLGLVIVLVLECPLWSSSWYLSSRFSQLSWEGLCCCALPFRYRVQSWGHTGRGSGHIVHGSGFRFQELGLRFKSLGCSAEGLGLSFFGL